MPIGLAIEDGTRVVMAKATAVARATTTDVLDCRIGNGRSEKGELGCGRIVGKEVKWTGINGSFIP